MFAAVFLPMFGLQSVLRAEPELHSRPAALVEGDTHKGVVCEATVAALAAGVCAGMSSPQALARCDGLVFKARSIPAEKAATQVLLQAVYAFSPHLEATAEGVCTVDLRGLGFECGIQNAECGTSAGVVQGSFAFLEKMAEQGAERGQKPRTPLEEWCLNLAAALASVHLHAQLGVAATPELALMAARMARPVLVVENAREFIGSLPVEALEPPAEMLDVLRRWGIRRMGELLALGKESVAERLGAEAVELFDRAAMDVVRPLDVMTPADTFEERMDFEVEVETLEPLLFVLRRFVEQLAARVALNYRVISELRLELTPGSGARHERTLSVPAPTGDVETLFRMLQTHLENVRTDAPIVSLCLAAKPCRAEQQQFGLFGSALRDPNRFHETLARLTALLGADRVGSPEAEETHRPDAVRMRVPEFGRGQDAKAGRRVAGQHGPCLRRFRPAVHADVETEEGRPVHVSTLTLNGRVCRARGPWKISGDWWDQRRWSRHEWDVQMRDGTLCRLFRAEGNWFLEGVYD
jgi:protein ImuB